MRSTDGFAPSLDVMSLGIWASAFLVRKRIVAPQCDAAEEASLIRNDGHVLGQFKVDLFRVAAAEVEAVEVERVLDLRDGFLQVLVPALLAVLIDAAAPDVILVGVLLPRVVAEFERDQAAGSEDGRAHAGAESDDHLDAFAPDGAVALDGRVVGHADGALPPLFKFALQREAGPRWVQVEGAPRNAALHHAGKSDRNAIER